MSRSVESLESRLHLHAGHDLDLPPVSVATPVKPAIELPAATVPAAAGDQLLPDLVALADSAKGWVHGWSVDTTELPAHALLRLTTVIGNAGEGPLEVIGAAVNPDGTQSVTQRTYLEGGGHTDRAAGAFVFHPAHGHTHLEDFSAYHLRSVTAGNGVGEIVASGDKVSFCLMDHVRYSPSLAASPGLANYVDCAMLQGISVGWADVYVKSLPDQWIDVTGVPDGRYWLEVVADPNDHLLESDETNNATRILIDLDLPSMDPAVVSTSPAGQHPGPVGAVDFRFDQPMIADSFDVADDLISFTGPGGSDLRGAVTGFSWPAPDTLRITFAAQAAKGDYAVGIGPQVLATDNARPMDQDRDEVPGETGQDAVNASFTVNPAFRPDGFGYEAVATTYEPVDLIPGAPGVLTLIDDRNNWAVPVDLGADTFTFYGTTYTGPMSMFVSTNGIITFGSGNTAPENENLTAVPAHPTIAPLWDDWDTGGDANDMVLASFQDFGGDGIHDRLVVEWNQVHPAGTSAAITFQAVLQLNTAGLPGAITFNYVNLAAGTVSADPGGATVGIKDGGSQGAMRLVLPQDVTARNFVSDATAIRVAAPSSPSTVVGRHLFYNNSAFDGHSPAADALDDAAIAPDKRPLLPGQTASFANYTSYVHGINGLMIDLLSLPPTAAPTAADFEFRVGNDSAPAAWAPAPAPAVNLRRGAGVNGSDRLTFVWPDGQIRKTWLQVTASASANTGLAAPDVFYFGNSIGESGNRSGDARVDKLDIKGIRRNRTRQGQAAVTTASVYDVDRNGVVDAGDAKLARLHRTRKVRRVWIGLNLITAV